MWRISFFENIEKRKDMVRLFEGDLVAGSCDVADQLFEFVY
jgi:hypothetical protein